MNLFSNNKKVRSVFIGYLDTCGYFANVHTGLKDIGCNSCSLFLVKDSVGREESMGLTFFPRLYLRIYLRYIFDTELSLRWPEKQFARFAVHGSRLLLLIWQIFAYDAFIYKSGESLYGHGFDLKVLRFFKKKIIFFFVGSDSRPNYLVGVPFDDDDDLKKANSVIEKKYARLKIIEPLADVIIANPLSAQLHSRKICIAQLIGNTVDPLSVEIGLAKKNTSRHHENVGTVRICHAPSDVNLKGTKEINSLIDELKNEGMDIEFTQVSNVPHSKVMETLANCDIVIDEIYSDSYGGIFALEACAFGKPVIVCGYGADELARIVPEDGAMRTVFCHPDMLRTNLVELINNKEKREEIGRTAKKYFLRSRPADVARRFLMVIEGNAPQTWFVEPHSIRYIEGIAGHRQIVAKNMQLYVEKFGLSALHLNDKPEMKSAILEFIDEVEAAE